jgi:hypothetical protein
MSNENTETEIIEGIPPKWRGVATLRIKGAEYKVSDKGRGNPMIILDTEIAAPEVVRSPEDGCTYSPLGAGVQWYLMLNKEKGNYKFVTEKLLPAFNIEMFPEGEEPSKEYLEQFKDLYFLSPLGTRLETDQTLDPDTNKYVPLIDPDTKEPITKGWQFASFFKDILRVTTKPEGYEPLPY